MICRQLGARKSESQLKILSNESLEREKEEIDLRDIKILSRVLGIHEWKGEKIDYEASGLGKQSNEGKIRFGGRSQFI